MNYSFSPISSLFQPLERFWSKHPALLYGLSSLLAYNLAISPSLPLALVLFLLYATCAANKWKLFKRMMQLCALNSAVLVYGLAACQLPEVQNEGEKGILYFEIEHLSMTEGPFGRQFAYQGYGKRFQSEDRSIAGRNFPCTVFVPQSRNILRPAANKAYLLEGTLKRGRSGGYFFTYSRHVPWHPVKGSRSLAEWRYHIKQKVKLFILRHVPDKRSASFLSGVITGQFEDRIMRAEFGRFGLLHLMAISGFHFAILAGILSFFLRFFLPRTLCVSVLVFLTSGYCFLLGNSPSVLRAWIMCCVTLTAWLLEKRSSALNALGIAFLFILIYQPLLSRTIGFQFSAAATASILLFYPLARKAMLKAIQIRPLSKVRNMTPLDQHCYCALSSFREGLALALAVNVIAAPLTLFYFQQFPILGILYNLFIPLLISGTMLLVLTASACHFIFPWAGALLFNSASALTHTMLNFIYNAPLSLNLYWRVDSFSLPTLLIYLGAVFLSGIVLYSSKGHDVENSFV